jgi:hypothetical protein
MTDPAKLREALDLASDASEEEVRTALVAAGFSAAPPPDPQPQASASEAKDLDSLRKQASKLGVELVESDNLAEMRARQDRQEAFIAQVRAQERDKIVDEAIKDGRIPPSKRATWIANWDANPDVVKSLVAQLTPGLVPMAELGYGIDLEDDDNLLNGMPSEFAGMWPQPAGKGR